MKTSRTLSLTVIGALAAGLLPLLAPTSAQAAPAPIVVTGGDVSTDGSSGWAVETRNGATGTFVKGTATPPLGTGSWSMMSNAIGDKKFLHLTKVDGTPLLGRPLADLTTLSFSTYAANSTYSPYVNIPIHSAFIDANNNGLADGSEPGVPAATGNAILVFEPVVASGTWAVSDTIGTPAQWRLTRPVVTGAGTVPIWTYQPYAVWTSLLTDGVINAVYGDIQWVIGDTSSAAWAGKEGWVDAITVTTTTETATYDLEEGLGSCPVAIDTANKALTLTANCTTSTTLTLHDGWSLDGAGYTITAIDPAPAVDFTGAVLTNELVAGGAEMDITNVTIDGNLDSGCSSSLFGVRFDGAAGSFTNSTVSDIKYGTGSGCQSGNSLDITNLGGPTRLSVTVDDVTVSGFQKTGIRANGNVALRLTDSRVADAELDLITASNSLQISRGARAYVSGNTFGGNDWDGNNLWNATGVLLYGAEDVTFTRNVITGSDTDYGLVVSQDATYQAGRTTLTCNVVERGAAPDSTPDPGTALDLWNVGIGADEDLIARIDAAGNTVRGFATPYENVVNDVGGPCASGPVSNLDVAGDATTLTATWDSPAALDFAPVTSYEVTLTPGGQVQTVSGTTASFTIVAGKEYTVTVIAENAGGRSPGRSASIDTSLPTMPTGLAVYGSAAYGNLTWTPSTAPSPVTSYTVVATPATGAPVTKGVPAAGLTFPVKVDGLTRNMTYAFSVRATNVFGDGPAATRTMKGTVTALTVTPTSLVYGKKITLTGKVTDAETGQPVAGQLLYLYTKTKGSTAYVNRGALATSAANGTFTFTYTAVASRRYFVTSRGEGRMGASSKSTYVSMKGTATMALSRTSVAAGTKVTFSGSVRPKTYSTVELQRKEGSTWVTRKTVVPASTGAYVVTWTPKSKKDYSWRVRVSGPKFTAGVSASKVLKVT